MHWTAATVNSTLILEYALHRNKEPEQSAPEAHLSLAEHSWDTRLRTAVLWRALECGDVH